MHVIVEQLTAGNPVRAGASQQRFGVDEFYPRPRGSDYGADDFVDPTIGAEAQDVEVAGPRQLLPCRGEIPKCPGDAPNSEMQLGVAIVDCGR